MTLDGESTQEEVFLDQAENAAGRSPLYAELGRRLAHDFHGAWMEWSA